MPAIKTTLQEPGHLLIPLEYRQALGLRPGDEVILSLEGRELHVRAPGSAIRRAQQLVRKYVPEDHNLVDELIEERRRESRLE